MLFNCNRQFLHHSRDKGWSAGWRCQALSCLPCLLLFTCQINIESLKVICNKYLTCCTIVDFLQQETFVCKILSWQLQFSYQRGFAVLHFIQQKYRHTASCLGQGLVHKYTILYAQCVGAVYISATQSYTEALHCSQCSTTSGEGYSLHEFSQDEPLPARV